MMRLALLFQHQMDAHNKSEQPESVESLSLLLTKNER